MACFGSKGMGFNKFPLIHSVGRLVGYAGAAASGSAAAERGSRASLAGSAQQPLPQPARRASGAGRGGTPGASGRAAASGLAALSAAASASRGRALAPSQSVTAGVAMPDIRAFRQQITL